MTDPKIKQADTFLESIIWSAEHARKILWSCEDDDGPTLQEIEKISDHLTDIEDDLMLTQNIVDEIFRKL